MDGIGAFFELSELGAFHIKEFGGGDIEVDLDEVGDVRVGVGEGPGEVAVAADDNAGEAGEGKAFDAPERSGGLAPKESGAIPDVGHAQVEVGIAGEEGAGGSAEAEGVGAWTGFGFEGR